MILTPLAVLIDDLLIAIVPGIALILGAYMFDRWLAKKFGKERKLRNQEAREDFEAFRDAIAEKLQKSRSNSQ